jgi:hypothetical protein
MLPLRYDAESRSGFIRLREGKVARSRRLSPQAVAEYGRHGQLLTMTLTELDPTGAEFLRTADEETLLAVIERQAGGGGRPRPRPPRRRGRR